VAAEMKVVKGAAHFGPGDVTDAPKEQEAFILKAMEDFLRRR
jgi:hypothetical protein